MMLGNRHKSAAEPKEKRSEPNMMAANGGQNRLRRWRCRSPGSLLGVDSGVRLALEAPTYRWESDSSDKMMDGTGNQEDEYYICCLRPGQFDRIGL